eukprot:TRINITY_DN16056_c0_g1_i1.p1 TRINITY_DN16056_c0_g1~~TRINITY_DN16056_c0_g1_i1.p1  ORF type:complete len:448 (+),score=200.81 TRINITY_DN16056_c0_g1_i1:94-1344(+)
MASAASVISAKKVSMIGIGRLGLCTALCFERAGWEVLGVDVIQSYVDAINQKTLRSTEPRVMEFLQKATKLRCTTGMKEALDFSDLIMILVATPTGGGDDVYDISVLSKVLGEINSYGVKNKHVVICCTVLPGYIAQIGRFLLRDSPGCTVSYNPEFIAQGDVIAGLLKPDCVLIGEGSKDAGEVLEALYKDSTENEPRICRMSAESAEIMKLSVNCFVTTKISYANMVGDICDRTPGADKFDVLKAVGADSRIGGKYILPGYGFGGPCFPRDNRALGNYARKVGIEPLICSATDKYNEYHADVMTRALLDQGLDHYVITDVAYKRCCPVDIIEESQPLLVATNLVKAGKKVTIRDRQGIVSLVQRHFGCLFLYEVADPAEAKTHGAVTDDARQPVKLQPLSSTLNMGNPLSSYRK